MYILLSKSIKPCIVSNYLILEFILISISAIIIGKKIAKTNIGF